MDKFLEKLNRTKSKINLSSERKEDLYLKIVSASLDKNRKINFPVESFWSAYLKKPISVVAGVFGIIILTAGTSFASESSLPGDILYPVKKNVNEAAMKFFADTPEKKSELAATLVERRLSEAAQLASVGRLTENVSNSLIIEVEQISNEANKQIALLKDEQRIDVAIREASRLETSLKANSLVLKGVVNKKERYDSVVAASLGSRVENLAVAAEGDRAKMENSALASEEPVGVMLFMAAKSIAPVAPTSTEEESKEGVFTKEYAENNLKEALNSIKELKEEAEKRKAEDDYDSAGIDTVINSAEKDVEGAKNSLENNDIKNSVLLINQSSRKVREAEIINKAEKKLKLKVFESEDKERE
jgi:hypothetical protein